MIYQKIILGLFLGIILLINLLSVKDKTLTVDEEAHYWYGQSILRLDSDRIVDDEGDPDNSKMPFSVLNALPGQVGGLFPPGPIRAFLCDIRTGRIVTIVFSLLVAVYIFIWAKELYGVIPAFFALTLYTFSPNIIAHSRFNTNDLYAAGTLLIAVYYFRLFLLYGGWGRAIVSAFTLGLCQLTKYSCIFIYPVFLLILLVKYWKELSGLIRTGDYRELLKRVATFIKFAVFFIAVSILVINAGFLFNGSFAPLEAYEFKSGLFQALQSRLGELKRLPVPLPEPYLIGFDTTKNLPKLAVYLLGEIRIGGFPGFYIYAFLYKVPIAIQIFVLLSVIGYLRNYKKYNFLENEVFLIVTIILYAIFFNIIKTMQRGQFRHFLIIFPLLFIFCGSLLKDWERLSLRFRVIVFLLVLYLMISVLSYWPHYISYFNELVWNRKQAYKIMADSNIEWGQNRKYLREYIREHPDSIVRPLVPKSGQIIVNVNDVVGLAHPERYRWLREHFQPVDHIAYTYLIYDVDPDILKRITKGSIR